jgi:7-carboxy-7-deazaguanine synthase (Cx14CxxC type)
MFSVKEIYYTLQGEGAQTGRAAVFCRFAGCNLWSGREADRATAFCNFCDTDFADTNGPGGGKFATADALAAAIEEKWDNGLLPGFKVETRGTDATAGPHSTAVADATSAQGRLSAAPLAQGASGSAQDDKAGVGLEEDGGGKRFVVCTGGEPLLQLDPALIEALHAHSFEIAVETNGTIAAPAGLDWICVSPKAGTELKQHSGDELKLVFPQSGFDPAQFESLAFRHFFLQPMDGPHREANTQAALRYCMQHPQWRLSLQTHKLLAIP